MDLSLDKLFETEVSPEVNGVTGVGLLAVDQTGKHLIEKYYGRRSSITQDKVDDQSLFWIYSITKTIAAISALQCVEQGLIGLDDEVYSVLPELRDFKILTQNPDGTQTFAAHKESITLRRLLTHTSGIGMDLFDPRLQAWRISRNEHPQAFSGESQKAYTIPLLFEPGQGWAYGGGVEWAGIMVERLSGLKLGEHMQKYIFDPLGMNSTTFHPDRDQALKDRLVETSVRISDGTLVPMKGPYPSITKDDSAAMGLVSSVPDMAKLTIELLKPQPTILKEESLNELFTSQFRPDTPAAQGLAFGSMMYGRLIGELYNPSKVGQALGAYFIKEDTNILPGNTLVMTGIPNLVWFINRDKGVGGLYASAIMPPDDESSSKLVCAFLKKVFS